MKLRAELSKPVGGPARLRDAMAGKKALSVAAMQRLRARFGIPADVLFDAMEAPLSASVAA